MVEWWSGVWDFGMHEHGVWMMMRLSGNEGCEMLVAWGIVISRGRCCLGLVPSSAMLCTAIEWGGGRTWASAHNV